VAAGPAGEYQQFSRSHPEFSRARRQKKKLARRFPLREESGPARGRSIRKRAKGNVFPRRLISAAPRNSALHIGQEAPRNLLRRTAGQSIQQEGQMGVPTGGVFRPDVSFSQACRWVEDEQDLVPLRRKAQRSLSLRERLPDHHPTPPSESSRRRVVGRHANFKISDPCSPPFLCAAREASRPARQATHDENCSSSVPAKREVSSFPPAKPLGPQLGVR